MKRALVLALLLAAGTAWLRGTPEYSYYRLRAALSNGDVATAEEHLDLSVISGIGVDLLAATTTQAAKEAAGAIGSVIVGAFADALAPVVKGALAPLTVDDIKKGIANKEYAAKIGNFEVAGPLDGMLSIQRLESSALVDLNGKCNGKSAKLKLVMEKKNGPVGGLVPNWRVTGVDKASLPDFVKACATEAPKADAAKPDAAKPGP